MPRVAPRLIEAYGLDAAFVIDIGSTEDGKSYLDRFRQVVTEVGNALGFGTAAFYRHVGNDGNA